MLRAIRVRMDLMAMWFPPAGFPSSNGSGGQDGEWFWFKSQYKPDETKYKAPQTFIALKSTPPHAMPRPTGQIRGQQNGCYSKKPRP